MADREVWRTRVHSQYHTRLDRESSRGCQGAIIQICQCLTCSASHAPKGRGSLTPFYFAAIMRWYLTPFRENRPREREPFLRTNHTVAGTEMRSCYQAYDEGA
jgi:hypothetical protein